MDHAQSLLLRLMKYSVLHGRMTQPEVVNMLNYYITLIITPQCTCAKEYQKIPLHKPTNSPSTNLQTPPPAHIHLKLMKPYNKSWKDISKIKK